MAKKRVSELAKELGLKNQEMVDKLQKWEGFENVKMHSSSLDDDQARRATERIMAERKPAAPPKPASGVVIRRSKAMGQTLGSTVEAAPVAPPPPPLEAPAEVVAVAPSVPHHEPEPEAVPVVATAPVHVAPASAEATGPQTPVLPETPVPARVELPTETEPAPVIPMPAPAPAPTAQPMAIAARAPVRVNTLPASAMRPGVSGTAANTRFAPTVRATPDAVIARPAHPLMEGEQLKPDEEIKMVNGVAHVVQKDVGKPTANQARVVSRPAFVERRVTPAAGAKSYPAAPGIKPGSLDRGIREVQVINEGGRRDLVDVRKGRRPSGARNEKVETYSKQDLLDLVRARAYVPVIGRKKRATKKGKKTEITAMKASKKVIGVEDTITIRELSEKMGVKATDIIRKLMKDSGGKLFTINHPLDFDTAVLVAVEHGWEVVQKKFEVSDFIPVIEDKPEDMKPRPPVVTVMGHVDHGKTSLLDAIRAADVASGEAGGITQHIGAYSVTLPGKGDITFLDTPGHEAFSAMRSRGAQATDIVILVVAADDGVQPQTIESIKHAKEADVPIVVAINKIDKPGTNPDVIKGALAGQGLQPEDWGGDTPMVPVSARQKTNLDLLLENVLLQAEVLELQSNPKKPAKGVVVESNIERGKGAVSTILVQDGTLKVGDSIVCGLYWGRVRTMSDDKGRAQQKVTAGYPVQVVGLNGTPEAGDDFNVVTDENIARKIADHRTLKARETELAQSARLTLEDLAKKIATDAPKELVLILKADVQGSVEAIGEALRKLSGKKVTVNVVAKGVGAVNENDVNQAKASKATIVGFNVKPDANASAAAQRDEISVKSYSIIYELIDAVRAQMEELLEPIYKERPLGKAEVKQVFSISKLGQIAGSMVTEGKVTRTAMVRVLRERKVVHSGKISSLRRFKDDVKEVTIGQDCGIGIEGYSELVNGDVLDVFEIETIRQKLD